MNDFSNTIETSNGIDIRKKTTSSHKITIMPRTVVLDHAMPGKLKEVDLPSDFQEYIRCQTNQNVDAFLSNNSPLVAAACWVHVASPTPDSTELDEKKMQQGLAFLQSKGDSVTMEQVHSVAHSSGCTCGKWKIRVDKSELMDVWGKVAKAVHGGKLKECTGAKVSTTYTQEQRGKGDSHTIYVYTSNYLTKSLVFGLKESLEELLKDSRAKLAEFKPDIYTYMGWGSGRMPPRVSSFLSFEKSCSLCGKHVPKCKRCSACKVALYCSLGCQKNHWKVHRPSCVSVRKEN